MKSQVEEPALSEMHRKLSHQQCFKNQTGLVGHRSGLAWAFGPDGNQTGVGPLEPTVQPVNRMNRSVQMILIFFYKKKTTSKRRHFGVLYNKIKISKAAGCNLQTPSLQSFLLRPPSMRPSRDTKTDPVDGLRYPYRSLRRPTTPTRVSPTLGSSLPLLRPSSMRPSRDTKTDLVDDLRHLHRSRQRPMTPRQVSPALESSSPLLAGSSPRR